MSYEKQTFVDNQTVLTARMMDHIEDGIVANETAITGASSSLASAFSTEAYYPSGSYVMKDGKLYVRTASGIGHGEWVAADWSETDIVTEMIARDDETMSRIYDIDEQTRKMIAPVYSTEEDYEIGDIVSYSDGKLYRCISPVSEEDWDSTKWENVTVESLLNDGNKDNANMNKLTEIQSSDVVFSQRWVQGTYNDSGTAVASTTNLRMYSPIPSNLVVKVDISGDYKYKIFRFNASNMTLVDKTEWILPDDDPVFISVDKTQRANVVLSRLDEATIDVSEASNVVVHLLYGNEYYSNVAETTGKNLIHYRMFNVNDGGANISFNDETESVIVTAVGNTDYQCAQFYLNELQQICKVGHQYRLSYEAEVLSGTPYIMMAVRGANGAPNARAYSIGPGSAAPSGTYSFTFTMNEYMGRIMAQVSETANNPGASVRYYNISLREVLLPDTAIDTVVREKVEETKGNEVALYPDMWFEFGGIDATDGTIYNGNATYMARNMRTANYVKVDHDGYIFFKNPDASKFNLRIVQYNLDYTVKEVQGLAYLESFCFMNSSDVMYKIQIDARGTTLDSEMPTLSECHVGVYYPVQFISGIGLSEPKNTYCIMTHNIGQWTTGSGTKMTANAPSWINLHDAIIERYSPDVLCLQEYLPYESITGNYYENSYAFNSPNNNVYSGKCILSNMPLENSTGGVYSNQASGSIACNWAKSYVWLGGHKVAIIATHLSTTLEKAQLQNAELKALADNEEYVIICGDFNVPCTATTDTNYINFFKPWVDAGYRMANGGQFGFMPTFYASSSVAKENGLCIDYIITSGNLDVSFACVDYQKYDAAIDTKIDHMPLVAYVSLSGAVRYDEEQTLTDTQKSTARGNISAASLVANGTAFSQAVQNGTTYDVQDAELREFIAQEFSITKNFTNGQFAWYNGNLYKFIAYHPAGAWTGTDVISANVTDDFTDRRVDVAVKEDAKIWNNLISVSNFTKLTYATTEVDTETGEITVTASNAAWATAETPDNWISDNLVIGRTYRFHARADVLSGTPMLIVGFRGVEGGANGMAANIPLPNRSNGFDSFVDFTVTEHTKRISLIITDATKASTSVKFGDVWLVDVTDGKVDAEAAGRIADPNFGIESYGCIAASKYDTGVLYTRSGNRITINGTNTQATGTTQHRIALTTPYTRMPTNNASSSAVASQTNPNAVWKAGHRYRVRINLVSGSCTQTNANYHSEIALIIKNLSSEVISHVKIDDIDTTLMSNGYLELVPSKQDYDRSVCVAIVQRPGCVFDNMVLDVWHEDIGTEYVTGSAINLVSFSQNTAEQRATVAGVDAIRKDNQITLNGTCTNEVGTYSRFRTGGQLITVTGLPSAWMNTDSCGAVLDPTHEYRFVARLISGTVTKEETASFAFYITPFKNGTATISNNRVVFSTDTTHIADRITGESGLTFWFTIDGGSVFNNAVFDLTLEDLTVAKETDYALTRVESLDILSNGLCSLDAYGPCATKKNNGYTFTKGFGNRVTIDGQYGGGSYFSVAMGNGINFTTSSTLPDTFVHFAMQKGHSYRITAQYVSGEINYDTYDCVIRYYQKVGSGAAVAVQLTSTLYADITNGKTVWTRYIQADATETTLFGYGFYIRGNKITNLVIDFTLEDVTGENLAYQISGATPNIVAAAGSRYICSATAVTQLTFTPCNSGICSVRFTAGSDMVLSVPNTVVWPDWFDYEHLEASRTYEISIEDGVYGVVTSWA